MHLPSQVFSNYTHTYWVYVPAQYDPKQAAGLMVFQDGPAMIATNGDVRVPNVLDNLIWRREIPVLITVFISPGITPDQPWASRRLVPAVVPAFVLLATWAVARIVDWLRERGYGLLPASGVSVVCSLALVIPGAVTTWGLRVSASAGITANGLGDKTLFGGELDAMQRLCRELPSDSTVVFVDPYLANRVMEVVRGTCELPTGAVVTSSGPGDPGVVKSVVADITATGRRPVLIGSSASQLRPFEGGGLSLAGRGFAGRGVVNHLVTLHTAGDPYTLTTPPRTPGTFGFDMWAWQPATR